MTSLTVRSTAQRHLRLGVVAAPARHAPWTPFVVAALVFTVLVGALTGTLDLWTLRVLQRAVPEAHRQAHAFGQLFGFLWLLTLGVSLHLAPKFFVVAEPSRELVRALAWGGIGGVVLVVVGRFGRLIPLSSPLGALGALAVLGTMTAWGHWLYRAWREGLAPKEPLHAFISAGAAWWWLASLGVVAWTGWPAALPLEAVWRAALFGGVGSWLWGVFFRAGICTLRVRRPELRRQWLLFALWQLAVLFAVAAALADARALQLAAGVTLAAACAWLWWLVRPFSGDGVAALGALQPRAVQAGLVFVALFGALQAWVAVRALDGWSPRPARRRRATRLHPRRGDPAGVRLRRPHGARLSGHRAALAPRVRRGRGAGGVRRRRAAGRALGAPRAPAAGRGVGRRRGAGRGEPRRLAAGVDSHGPREGAGARLMSAARKVSLCLLFLTTSLAATSAHAAACCLSVSVVGAGRLTAWEAGAGGITSSFAHSTGRWSGSGAWRAFDGTLLQDELRFEAWGIVRLAEAWQLSARAPWVVGLRTAGDTSSWGTGPGDVSAAVRWEAVPLGAWLHVPGIALTAGVTGPTGRRPELATDALGASITGRGAFGGSLGVTVEETWNPWFLRVDAGATVFAPFTRADTRASQWLGPNVQVALSGGRELFEKLVLAVSVRVDHDFPYSLDGHAITGSAATTLSASGSAAWKVTSHWTLTAAVVADALGSNREARLAATIGVRHGFF